MSLAYSKRGADRRKCSVCLIRGRMIRGGWHDGSPLLLKALDVVGLETLAVVKVEICKFAFASSTASFGLVASLKVPRKVSSRLVKSRLGALVMVVLEGGLKLGVFVVILFRCRALHGLRRVCRDCLP